MMTARKKPEVIIFKEPIFKERKTGREAARERKKFLSGDVSEIFRSQSGAGALKESEQSSKNMESNILDFKATLRDVQSLALSTLSGKDKRKLEQEQIEALGAKPPKSEFVPYPHYQRVVKAKREKEKRLEEQLRLTQMATKKRKKTQTKLSGQGRWKDTTKSLEPSLGKFKGGVLKLSQKDIALVKTKNKRTKK